MGTPVNTEAQLMAGTGGRTVTNYGSYNTGLSLSKPINPAYVTPSMQPIVTMINNGLGNGPGGSSRADISTRIPQIEWRPVFSESRTIGQKKTLH